MVLAWIMTRENEAVRAMWDRWRRGKEIWAFKGNWQVPGGPIYDGYWIEDLGPAGLIDPQVQQRRNAANGDCGNPIISRKAP
jgi:hypothetical protein